MFLYSFKFLIGIVLGHCTYPSTNSLTQVVSNISMLTLTAKVHTITSTRFFHFHHELGSLIFFHNKKSTRQFSTHLVLYFYVTCNNPFTNDRFNLQIGERKVRHATNTCSTCCQRLLLRNLT